MSFCAFGHGVHFGYGFVVGRLFGVNPRRRQRQNAMASRRLRPTRCRRKTTRPAAEPVALCTTALRCRGQRRMSTKLASCRIRRRKAGSADRAFGQGRLDDARMLASASPSRRRGSDVAAVHTRVLPTVRRQKRHRPHGHPSGRSSGRRRVQRRTWFPTRCGEDRPAFGQTQKPCSVSRRTPSGARSDTRRALRGT